MRINKIENKKYSARSFGISYSKKAHGMVMKYCKDEKVKEILDNYSNNNTKLRRVFVHNSDKGDVLELNFRLRTAPEKTKVISTKMPFDDKSSKSFVKKVKLGTNRVEQKIINDTLLKNAQRGTLRDATEFLKDIYPHRKKFIEVKGNKYYLINAENTNCNDEIDLQKPSFLESLLAKLFR